jgi:hypothetical protein
MLLKTQTKNAIVALAFASHESQSQWSATLAMWRTGIRTKDARDRRTLKHRSGNASADHSRPAPDRPRTNPWAHFSKTIGLCYDAQLEGSFTDEEEALAYLAAILSDLQ